MTYKSNASLEDYILKDEFLSFCIVIDTYPEKRNSQSFVFKFIWIVTLHWYIKFMPF